MITGSRYSTLSFSFRVGKSTVCNIIHETTRAVWTNLNPLDMPVPDQHQFINIAHDFFNTTGFPHCLGALDVKHIRIKRPAHSGSKYFNFKRFYSIALQAVVDSKNKFIFIEVGAHGSQHDSRTFKRSALYRVISSKRLNLPEPMPLPHSGFNVPFVFIADGAYALSSWVMKPFRRPNLTPARKLFNHKLSIARSIVEQTFGQLAKRFNIFFHMMEQPPKTAEDIVKCACLLHNIIINHCRDNESLGGQIHCDFDFQPEDSVDSDVDGCDVRE